jgi:hypothetical protein
MKQRGERIIFPSRLFLFYNSRAMERTERSDEGVYIRDAIKAVARHGDCPESLWRYKEHNFATRPPKKCYESALKYRAVKYYRLHRNLDDMRTCLASGYPFVFGFTVYEAGNGKEAGEKAQEFLPDIILMDIQMPVMNGIDSTRLLKADPATCKIPVIALT